MATLVPDLIKDQAFSRASPKQTVREAARIMAERNIGAILVLENARLVGVFSERDLLIRVVAAGLDPDTTPLSDVMTCDPDTLSPSADVRDALRLMVAHDYRHVPVVEGSRVVGIIAARDIYNTIVKGMQTGVSALARQLLHG
jgi:CBS domain-containing protein